MKNTKLFIALERNRNPRK